MSPSTAGSVGGRGSGVGVDIRGTIDGREDSTPACLGGAEDLGCSVDEGSEERPTSRWLDGGAVAGTVGWLWPVGV